MTRATTTLLASLGLTACTFDQGFLGLGWGSEPGETGAGVAADSGCVGDYDPVDVSVLDNAMAIRGGRDAAATRLPYELPEGASWRIHRVDVLVVVPQNGFDTMDDGQPLSVSVWPSHDLDQPQWSLRQVFDKDALSWEDLRLPDAASTEVVYHSMAWWSFDMSELIPLGSFPDGRFGAGVGWSLNSEQPTIGFSNYELPCEGNWTDWGEHDDWEPNGEGRHCAWPVLKVHIEVEPDC